MSRHLAGACQFGAWTERDPASTEREDTQRPNPTSGCHEARPRGVPAELKRHITAQIDGVTVNAGG